MPLDRPPRDLSREPTVTAGMGMKWDTTSIHCWRTQCSREDRIRREWERQYLPALRDDDDTILERRIHQEAAEAEAKRQLNRTERRELFDGVSKDGKGRVAYLKARRLMTPQQRFGDATPTTASQLVGWTVERHRDDRTYGPLGGCYGRRGLGPAAPTTIQLM